MQETPLSTGLHLEVRNRVLMTESPVLISLQLERSAKR